MKPEDLRRPLGEQEVVVDVDALQSVDLLNFVHEVKDRPKLQAGLKTRLYAFGQIRAVPIAGEGDVV